MAKLYVVYRSTNDYYESHPEFVAAFTDRETAEAYAANRQGHYGELWVATEDLNPSIPETTALEEEVAEMEAARRERARLGLSTAERVIPSWTKVLDPDETPIWNMMKQAAARAEASAASGIIEWGEAPMVIEVIDDLEIQDGE